MRLLFLLASLLVLGGCADGSELTDPAQAAAWANSGSALATFIPAYQPVALAEGRETLEDPACPAVEDDGTTLVITGGCTDTEGVEWVGSATVERQSDGGYDVSFDGFGRAEESPNRITGTMRILHPAADRWSYDADYEQDGLLALTVDYSGTIEGGFDGPTVWGGRGTVTRGGFTDASGTAAVTTLAQRRDPACGNQSWSGTTTVELDAQTLLVTYNGETDCDEASSATYAVDGEALGALPGVTCSVAAGAGAPGVGVLLVGALGLLLARRRRRQGN